MCLSGRTCLSRIISEVLWDFSAPLQAGDYGVEFSHGIEDIVGGQLRAGLRLLDIFGDTNGSGILHDHGAQCFYATLSLKP